VSSPDVSRLAQQCVEALRNVQGEWWFDVRDGEPSSDCETALDALAGPLSSFVAETQQAPPAGWQPIETAPKTGAWILVCHHAWEYPEIAGWNGRAWKSYSDVIESPNLWMPLPPMPKKEPVNDAQR